MLCLSFRASVKKYCIFTHILLWMELPAHTHRKWGSTALWHPLNTALVSLLWTALGSCLALFPRTPLTPGFVALAFSYPLRDICSWWATDSSQLPSVFAAGTWADLFSYCELSRGLFNLFCEYWFILNNKAYFQSRQTLNWCFKSVFFKLFLLKYEGLIFQGSTD